MANIVNRCRTDITAIYITRTTSRSIIYISVHSSQIAFAIRPIYINISHAVGIASIVIRNTQIRIIYATRVDIIYTESTPRTRTACVAGTNAGRERTSSVQIIGDWVTVVTN